jgi:hypothetical protein
VGWYRVLLHQLFRLYDGIIDILTSCLRRLTFFQQLKKVSKKSRPSGAGEADFPQIPSVGTWRVVACQVGCF